MHIHTLFMTDSYTEQNYFYYNKQLCILQYGGLHVHTTV